MISNNYFKGSTLNVSPLCQGCKLIHFAEQNNIMFHQCEICQNEYDRLRYNIMNKECLYCLKNEDDREVIKAGGHGIRMKLMNEDNKWWIYARSIKAWNEQKDIYHAPIIRIENEFNEEVQIKYCPWCGRKLTND